MDFSILEPVNAAPDAATKPPMKIIFLLFALLSFLPFYKAQDCADFATDTMTIPETGKTVEGEYIEATLKNQSVVRFMRTADGRIFLRLIVTENFYFGKVAMLEIRSGSKSYWVKNAKQHKIDKTHGLFVTEIFRNYVATLRDHGITGIEFGGAYTDFSKSDASLIKEAAGCMYKLLDQKRKEHE